MTAWVIIRNQNSWHHGCWHRRWKRRKRIIINDFYSIIRHIVYVCVVIYLSKIFLYCLLFYYTITKDASLAIPQTPSESSSSERPMRT